MSVDGLIIIKFQFVTKYFWTKSRFNVVFYHKVECKATFTYNLSEFNVIITRDLMKMSVLF